MNIDFRYAFSQFPQILAYVGVTMKITVLSMFFTLILALGITMIRYYRVRILTPIVNVYIDVFRGTPR